MRIEYGCMIDIIMHTEVLAIKAIHITCSTKCEMAHIDILETSNCDIILYHVYEYLLDYM